MSEFRSCVKVEVDVLGSPSLISLRVSVRRKATLKLNVVRAQELLSESR